MDGMLIGHSKATEDLFIFVPGRNMLFSREERGEGDRGKTPILPPPAPFLLSDSLRWQNQHVFRLMLKIWALGLQRQGRGNSGLGPLLLLCLASLTSLLLPLHKVVAYSRGTLESITSAY